MSKRKVGGTDINKRDTKRVKQEESPDQPQDYFVLVPKDCRRDIVKYIDDLDILKSLRVSKLWKEEACAEINSRFAKKHLARLRAMSPPSPSLNEAQITDRLQEINALVNEAKNEISAMKQQLAKLGNMKLTKLQDNKTLSITERFDQWNGSCTVKKTYTSMRDCPVQPPGEVNVWELLGYDNLSDRSEFDLDSICEFLWDYLWSDSEDEATVTARYEQYLLVLMQLEFGRVLLSN